MRPISEQQEAAIWQQFQSLVVPDLFNKTGLAWDQVNRRMMNYVITHAKGKPWLNPLALLLGVSTCYAHLGDKTILSRLNALHCRWSTMFRLYGLTDFHEWKPEEHLARYMHDPDIPDTIETRQDFLNLTPLRRTRYKCTFAFFHNKNKHLFNLGAFLPFHRDCGNS
jgi:hypothetical protein